MHDQSLVLVPAGMHTAADLVWIWEADKQQPQIEQLSLASVDASLRTGQMHLLRLVPGPGCFLVEVRQDHGVKRLALLRGAGVMGLRTRSVVRLMGVIAKQWGCECVETVVYSPRLERALVLAGCKREATVLTFGLEADDGQQEEERN